MRESATVEGTVSLVPAAFAVLRLAIKDLAFAPDIVGMIRTIAGVLLPDAGRAVLSPGTINLRAANLILGSLDDRLSFIHGILHKM